jgi:hypothetical protein
MTTEDNWETADYSNIILEQKRLTERKLVEESDNNIANELFQDRLPSITNTIILNNNDIYNNNNVKPVKKEHHIHFPKPIRPRPNLDLLVKLQKENKKQHADKFGDYVFDKYEDNYIDLEDKVNPNK